MGVDMMVTDTKGQHFVNREKTDKGKFGFTTDNYDVFEICFISRVPANMRGGRHEIFLATKHGVEAKNYEGLGDAAKLKPLEVNYIQLLHVKCVHQMKILYCEHLKDVKYLRF